VLSELKEVLRSAQATYNDKAGISELPNFYIVGCARSGTTYLYQLLSKVLEVAYPTNFLSRFYYAPYLGAKMQYLLSDLDINNEILGKGSDFSLSSNLGKTKGALAPHEFWYFWREHFRINKRGYIQPPNSNELENFEGELNSIKNVFGRPLMMKGMIANNCIDQFVRQGSDNVVIYIKREVDFNAQSLLKARFDFFGDKEKWYSFGIDPKYQKGSIYEQVVNQVHHTNLEIESAISKLPEKNRIQIQYENLDEEFESVISHLGVERRSGVEIDRSMISCKNSIMDLNDWKSIQEAIKRLGLKE
jgi:hypothetical protein